MLFSSPLFAGTVPPRIRIFYGAIFSLAITPAIKQFQPEIPQDMYGLLAAIAAEIAVGLIIGMCIQMLLISAQMAGSFLDMQFGLSSVQLFNPSLGSVSSILGQMKFMLALVLFLQLDGHHLMIRALVESYQITPHFETANLGALHTAILGLASKMFMIALQMAAPAAAVAVIIDAAAALINKAIPQMQVYFVSAGVKSGLGILTLAFGLPVIVSVVKMATEQTSYSIAEALGALK